MERIIGMVSLYFEEGRHPELAKDLDYENMDSSLYSNDETSKNSGINAILQYHHVSN